MKIDKWFHMYGTKDNIVFEEALPAAQPEIVHCKDCKHWKDSDGVYRRGRDAESKCPINLKEVYDGAFYCGKAERKQMDDLTHVPDTNVGDIISRQAAIDAMVKLNKEDLEDYGVDIPEAFNIDCLDRATYALGALPSAQPQRMRGRWVASIGNAVKCDQCDRYSRRRHNYCPNCGADMREKE